MDIRRLRLWESRNATILSNDIIRAVVEDQGGMGLELSSPVSHGGRINALHVPAYRGIGSSVFGDENAEFWHNSPYCYQRSGSCFCFPECGVRHPDIEDRDLTTAETYWMVERYGTDPEFGGVWLMSLARNRKAHWDVRRVDMLLPDQPVLYSACIIANKSDEDIISHARWSVQVGSPFLESGCEINAGAQSWVAGTSFLAPGVRSRLMEGGVFENLKKAPLASAGSVDLSVIPSPNGTTDAIAGLVPRSSRMGWSSIINPRQQMVFFTFFPGPAAVEEGEIAIPYNNFLFDFGRRSETPWALYPGGMSQQYCLDCGSGANHLMSGNAGTTYPFEIPPTLIIPKGETRTICYATAFCPYENSRIGGNFYSVEQVVEGIVLKRTKSWAFIAADSTFHCLRQLTKRLLTSE